MWISTSDRNYSLRGVRPGATPFDAARRLHPEPKFHLGRSDWYLPPNGSATAILKVGRVIVEEINIADRRLTSSPLAERTFATSFS